MPNLVFKVLITQKIEHNLQAKFWFGTRCEGSYIRPNLARKILEQVSLLQEFAVLYRLVGSRFVQRRCSVM